MAAFERVRAELAVIDSIEDAFKLRERAELLRVLAVKIKASKSTLDEIAAVKVRAERRLGALLASRPETRGGDHKSVEFQESKDNGESFDPPPTLETLGVPKHVSRRSQIMASIPEDMFEARIEYTKKLNRGRDLSAEMWSYAKYLKREQERQERREEASARAAEMGPDEKIRILHGDFREVLTDIVPDNTSSLVLTDPPYLRKDGTYLDLWESLSDVSNRILQPGKLLVCYSGKFWLDQVMTALGTHLRYVWTTAVVYPSFPDTIHALRIKSYFKLALMYSKGPYEPLMTPFWFKDVVEGDGYKGLKEHHAWQQGLKEAETLIESLTEEGDLVVDAFLGSGTVAVAAKRLNRRRLVGCDESIDAVNTALARLAQEPKSEAQ
jgi:hypothetical protein